MYRLSLKLNLIIYTTNKKEKEKKKKNAYHVNSAVNAPVQCTPKTPKTHVKCCSKSQMLVSVSAPNGDFVSSSSSSSTNNSSNTVL